MVRNAIVVTICGSLAQPPAVLKCYQCIGLQNDYDIEEERGPKKISLKVSKRPNNTQPNRSVYAIGSPSGCQSTFFGQSPAGSRPHELSLSEINIFKSKQSALQHAAAHLRGRFAQPE